MASDERFSRTKHYHRADKARQLVGQGLGWPHLTKVNTSQYLIWTLLHSSGDAKHTRRPPKPASLSQNTPKATSKASVGFVPKLKEYENYQCKESDPHLAFMANGHLAVIGI
jgi:hypothetical protein